MSEGQYCKAMIHGENGYDIPVVYRLAGDASQLVVISHGFGSSKESPMAQMLMDRLAREGMGAVAYDFPNHGDSLSGPEGLRIGNCIRDLATVESWAAAQAPAAVFYYFSSSFGAWINLQYLTLVKHRGIGSFLRSAAVNMNEYFMYPTKGQQEAMEQEGRVTLPLQPPMTVTKEFVEEMRQHDLFRIYKREGQPVKTSVRMIHGSADTTISLHKAKAFAETFHIPLTIVPGGAHRLMGEGQPEQVMDEALAFWRALERKREPVSPGKEE